MDIGHRLLTSTVDFYATHQPEKVWAVAPRINEDIKSGLLEINFRQFADAVNHAAWWLQERLPAEPKSATFAYQGPNDARVPILCLAAAKIGRQILLPSTVARPDAQIHLISISRCSACVRAASTMPAFDPAALELHVLEVPELAEWLNSEPAKPFPFTGTWSELKDRPWILFHSSGTTGLPKVIPYTHEMMASVDAARLLEDTKDSTMFDEFRGGRWFSSVPMSHCASLVVALQLTVFLDVVLVLGPSTVPLTDQQLVDIVDLAGLDGIFAVPGDYERLAKDTRGWQSLVKIKKINYVGAQLRQTLGDSLEASGARVFCCMGTTEAGYYHLKSRKDASWEWVTPVSAMGATFERYIGDDEMYELIFTRESGLERYQQVFKVYPDLSEYHTKDLFVKHPTKSDAWKPVGRTDDFMKLLHGHGLYTARIEERLLEATHGTFQYILVGGQGHDKPCVLAMPKSHEITDSSARRQLLAQLWAAVVAVNNTSSPWAQVPRHLLMLMDPQRPVKLTSKGTVSRMETLSLYEADISLLYSPQGPSE